MVALAGWYNFPSPLAFCQIRWCLKSLTCTCSPSIPGCRQIRWCLKCRTGTNHPSIPGCRHIRWCLKRLPGTNHPSLSGCRHIRWCLKCRTGTNHPTIFGLSRIRWCSKSLLGINHTSIFGFDQIRWALDKKCSKMLHPSLAISQIRCRASSKKPKRATSIFSSVHIGWCSVDFIRRIYKWTMQKKPGLCSWKAITARRQ